MNWPYIAGFFDGEGNIAKHRTRRAYRLTISQHLRAREVLDTIQEFLFGQGITSQMYCSRSRAKLRSPMGDLVLSRAESVVAFLANVLPYLHVKREAALVMLSAAQKWLAEEGARRTRLTLAANGYEKGESFGVLCKRHRIGWKPLQRELVSRGIVIPARGRNQYSEFILVKKSPAADGPICIQ